MRLQVTVLLCTWLIASNSSATTGSHTVAPAAGAPTLDGTAVVNTRPELCGPSAGVVITPEQFGANGDDALDDSAALQNALRSCAAQCTLQLTAGKWYRVAWGIGSNAVLHLDRPNVQLRGNGTNGGIYVVMTDEQQQCSFTGGSPTGNPSCAQTNGQAIHLAAPNTDIINVTVTTNTRYRSAGNPQGAGLWVDSVEHDICGNRFEYAPFYLRGASNYRIIGNAIFRAYADPIHQTDSSSTETKRIGNAIVQWNHIAQSGDDGIAVVDRGVTNMSGYTITDNIVQDGYWGRGIGIDGADNVTVARNTVLRQVMAASILVHADTVAFGAAKTTRVVLRGNTITQNQSRVEPPWHPCHWFWPVSSFTNHWAAFQTCLSETAGNTGWNVNKAGFFTGHAAIDILGRDNTGDTRPPIDSRVADLVIEDNAITSVSEGAVRARDYICGVRLKRNTLTSIGGTAWRESYTGVPGGLGALAPLCKAVGVYTAGITECQQNTRDGAVFNCQ